MNKYFQTILYVDDNVVENIIQLDVSFIHFYLQNSEKFEYLKTVYKYI